MTPEEFVNRHFEVIQEALAAYQNKTEENSATAGELVKLSPSNPVYHDLLSDLRVMEDRANKARSDFFKLAQKMGKL